MRSTSLPTGPLTAFARLDVMMKKLNFPRLAPQ
jgi:hypothetical protein